MTDKQDEPDGSRLGVVWLLTDMAIVTVMTVVVKIQGSSYPAVQLVFIRSLVGMLAILPMVWRNRAAIAGTTRPGRHIFRVFCNAVAITGNFAALAALPLALANAIGFIRPIVVMLLALVLLAERIGPLRWVGAGIGLVGALIMVSPGSVDWSWGLAAAFLSVFFGSLATIQIRALKTENTMTMMVFYTVGLAVFTGLPALWFWQPVAAADWPPIILIGVLAQTAQYFYLKAYQSTPVGILSPFTYMSIVFATAAGYLAFGEVPSWQTAIGVLVIFAGLGIANRFDRKPGASK
jgi:drug/metabolite transporter (DMT)-like permease